MSRLFKTVELRSKERWKREFREVEKHTNYYITYRVYHTMVKAKTGTKNYANQMKRGRVGPV